MKTIDLKTLQSAVAGSAAAFRARTRLQPAGGEGDKAFPPTYAGAVYATEERRVKQTDGSYATIPCVLMDSVQSQANRLEEALQLAIDAGRFDDCPLPLIEVDFSGLELLDEIGRITSLQAPHRAADAILRDSLLDGTPFRKSDIGKKLDYASLNNATPLYEICPTALIFGIWDSTGPKGGLGAKFQRALVSEIVGINAQTGAKTSSRIDPLQIRAAAKVMKSKDGYTLAKNDSAKGAVSPSEVNHGNIPPDVDQKTGGVTLHYAEQTTVLSLPALRRLRFPINGGVPTPESDAAGRTVLAALALTASALAAENGYDLRSRCLLWPEDELQWELLEKPGAKPSVLTLDAESAIRTLKEAVAAAVKAGLTWRKEPLKLTPAPQLVELLQRSQEIAAAEATEEDGA
ncbi:MAG: type I-U CRISPR-associated protein Cas7 [Opitutales bacterium]|nr:type I-U CRISPR-associated protein Cas7 [Opitutales bacterium]